MKNQLDLKSLLIGFLSAALLIMAFGFKNNGSGVNGKYQTEVGVNGIIILDVETGEYVITTNMANIAWRKGDFKNTHKTSKDNLKN